MSVEGMTHERCRQCDGERRERCRMRRKDDASRAPATGREMREGLGKCVGLAKRHQKRDEKKRHQFHQFHEQKKTEMNATHCLGHCWVLAFQRVFIILRVLVVLILPGEAATPCNHDKTKGGLFFINLSPLHSRGRHWGVKRVSGLYIGQPARRLARSKLWQRKKAK